MADVTWLVAGVDEVGRGPLAGPVVAAAVILASAGTIDGLTDSKKLTAAQRESLAVRIRETAVAWALGRAECEEIDRFNILRASLLAMRRAVEALPRAPHHVLVDGIHAPAVSGRVDTCAGGDARLPAVSAASILAKVARDAEMSELDQSFPGYGFAAHKGYPTPVHLAALQRLGPSPVHRLSFAPVRRVSAGSRLP